MKLRLADVQHILCSVGFRTVRIDYLSKFSRLTGNSFLINAIEDCKCDNRIEITIPMTQHYSSPTPNLIIRQVEWKSGQWSTVVFDVSSAVIGRLPQHGALSQQ